MTKKIIEWNNENEVKIIPKKIQKIRVFLKNFFNYLVKLYFNVIFVVFH